VGRGWGWGSQIRHHSCQTRDGDGGTDILIGYSGGQDTFKDTAAHLTTSTIQNFQATDLIDITDHAFTAQTSVNFVPTGAQARVLNVVDAGSTVARISIQGQFISFAVSSDGHGGILVTDPPLPTGTEVSTHKAFADAWHTLMGGKETGASSPHGLRDHFDFSALTPKSPLPEAAHASLQDFSGYSTVLIRDGPTQGVQLTPVSADDEHHASVAAQPHDYADMHFDFSRPVPS
jgi:hypothetical protein